MTRFSLKFASTEVKVRAVRYRDSSSPDNDALVQSIVPRVRQRGYFTKRNLVAIGTWRSPRIRSRPNRISYQLVRETTGVAFSPRAEELRIGVLSVLYGADWPVASQENDT